MEKSAKFVAFLDLLASSDPSEKGMLRVIGRVEQYDIRNSLVILQDPSTKSLQIAIDVSNIEPFSPKVGVLHQFIGEADYKDIPTSNENGHKWVVVKALVHRCMDGLNMDAYMKSHHLRMKDLISD